MTDITKIKITNDPYSGPRPKTESKYRTLISTAPDMYEALKTARNHLVMLGGDPRGTEHGDTIQGAILDVCDEALKKAVPDA